MSYTNSKLTLEQRSGFQNYLEYHKMSQGKSLWEVVSGAKAQTFRGIEGNQNMPPPSKPLPPKQARLVSYYFSSLRNFCGTKCTSFADSLAFFVGTGSLTIPFSETGTDPGYNVSSVFSLCSIKSDYEERSELEGRG